MRRLAKCCFLSTALTLLLLSCSRSSAAVIVFEDTFDSDSLGLALTGSSALTQWNITAGNLDVVGPTLFDLFPGNGRYVDMGGTSSNATIQTKSLLSLTPGTYELSFELAFPGGFNQNVLDYSVGTLLLGSIAPTSSSTLTPVSFTFFVATTTNVGITFSETGPLIDDGGTILNDVRLTLVNAIPEPSTLTLLSIGGIALFGYGWRRKRRQAA